jgi:hypothetical protein
VEFQRRSRTLRNGSSRRVGFVHETFDEASAGGYLIQPQGRLRLASGVSRRLYACSWDFCRRLAALEDAQLERICSDWYRLLFPFLPTEALPVIVTSATRSQQRGIILRELARLAPIN